MFHGRVSAGTRTHSAYATPGPASMYVPDVLRNPDRLAVPMTRWRFMTSAARTQRLFSRRDPCINSIATTSTRYRPGCRVVRLPV